MIELELLGANGDCVVMTDPDGTRYSIVVDDALRAAVRRARPAALSPETPVPGATVRPKDLQALMRAGATASEVAHATGLDVDHVRRFEGPVIAERTWAVGQAQTCRIGWETDSPVLGELVVDRLATRGVEPSSLSWDAVREGRDPWQVLLTFIQGAEERQARWELDLTARSVLAMDDEARWLTEAGAQPPEVFDQDSAASSARSTSGDGSGAQQAQSALSPAPAPAPPSAQTPVAPSAPDSSTDALLADLASSRGRRMSVEPPVEMLPEADPDVDPEEQALLDAMIAAGIDPPASDPNAITAPHGHAQIVSMSERRRAMTGNHPAGSRMAQTEELSEVPAPPPGQEADGAQAPAPRPRRRPRRSVPSWDEIVFGAKPE